MHIDCLYDKLEEIQEGMSKERKDRAREKNQLRKDFEELRKHIEDKNKELAKGADRIKQY